MSTTKVQPVEVQFPSGEIKSREGQRGDVMTHTYRATVIAMLFVVLCAPAWAQLGFKSEFRDKSGNPVCGYRATDHAYQMLKEGESFQDSVHAVDGTGKERIVPEVATCRKFDQGLAIDLAFGPLEGQPVVPYHFVRPSSGYALAALKAGESVQDRFYVSTVDNQVKELPVTITCVKRGGQLYLDATATLDGMPVEFYADAQKKWFALKHGEHVPGTSKINFV